VRAMKLKDCKFYDEILKIYLEAEDIDVDLHVDRDDILAVERREYDDIYTSDHIVEYTIAFNNTCTTIVLKKITRKNGAVVYTGEII